MSARHHTHGILPLHSTDATAGLGVTLAATPTAKVGTITTAITHEVTLGGHYLRHLTIAATGSIAPTTSGVTALYDPTTIAKAHIVNLGSITGGAATTTNGGIGVHLAGTGSSLTNSGTITGGGNAPGQASYNGGAAAVLGAGTALNNTGIIAGGASYSGATELLGKDGGAGVLIGGAATLTNSGTIIGGLGYMYSGAGVDVEGAGATITNNGTIIAGGLDTSIAGGNSGILLNQSATVINHGQIAGSFAGNNTGSGDGILANASAALTSTGLISGGASQGAEGGAGVYFLSGGSLSNSGTIAGGAGNNYYGYHTVVRGNGGTGLIFDASGTMMNTGTILGGSSEGGSGGIGVRLNGAAILTNSGTIAGGATSDFQESTGGDGLELSGGATAINTGAIQGASGVRGGAGVYVDGGTLTTSGIVTGGDGSKTSLDGAAVQFGAIASTLVVEQGATFSGLVTANTAAQDTLTLGTAAAATLSGFGTEFTNFATLTEIAGATWTLTNTAAIAATTSLDIAGNLILAGSVSDAGLLTNTGTISGTTGTLSFLGTITNNGIFDTGTGLLAITPLVEGTGNLDISAGGTLNLGNGAISTETIDFLANTGLAVLQHPFSFVGSIEGFVTGDRIDLTKPTGFQENGSSWANNTLTLTENGATVATLHFDGTYNPNDFTLASDGHNGIFLTYT